LIYKAYKFNKSEMKVYRIKKRINGGSEIYLVQKRKFLIFWSTIEELSSMDCANTAISELGEADYYSWVRNRMIK